MLCGRDVELFGVMLGSARPLDASRIVPREAECGAGNAAAMSA